MSLLPLWNMTHHLLCGIVILLAYCSARPALAIKDLDNQGCWTKPTEHNLPDKEVPGFLINLGPTGARGVLTARLERLVQAAAGVEPKPSQKGTAPPFSTAVNMFQWLESVGRI